MADVKNALQQKAAAAPQAGQGPRSIKDWIVVMKPQIAAALPDVITVERFTRMALTAVSREPKLADCTPTSFMGALMQAAQLGLEPNTPLGQAYLIPYRNKGRNEVQFQLGYQGLIELAHRSGQFRNIEARVVHENDEFEYEYGLEPKLLHRPAMANRGNPVAYYAVFTLVNGGFGFEVMSKEDVDAHARQYSQSFGSGFSPWRTAYDSMAKKTLIKRVLKYAPISVEFAREVASDGAVKTEISSEMVNVEPENVFESEAEVVEEGEAAAEPLDMQPAIEGAAGTEAAK